MHSWNSLSLFTFMLVAIYFFPLHAFAEKDIEQQGIIDRSVAVLERFSTDKKMGSFNTVVKKARAVLIVPTMFKGGLVFGGSTGTGVLLAHDAATDAWSYPVFYSINGLSFGLLAGVETSQLVLLVMTEKGLESILEQSFKLGADATIAAGPYGAGAKVATSDIISYAISKGVYGGLSIEGAQIEAKQEWNTRYYGNNMNPSDIIVAKTAANPAAQLLRETLKQITQ